MKASNNVILDAEKAVLCVVLNDAHVIVPLMDVLTDADMFSVEMHRRVFTAVLELTRTNVVPNVYTVASASGVAVADLQALAAGFNTKMSKEVLYTAELICKDANYRRVRDAAIEAASIASAEKTDDPVGLAEFCAELIISSADDKNMASPKITEVSKRVDVEIADLASGATGISLGTNLAWLQDKTSGFRAGHIWIIAAPYKGRKTTLLRNMLIAPCRTGASVSLFALEGTEAGSYAGLVAMLATERLLEWGLGIQAFLSEISILQGTRTPEQQQAIVEARTEIDSWNLRIYDGRSGITQPDKLVHFIKRDRIMHGLNIFAVDYLQLLGGGKLFDRMEESTHQLQRITVEEGLTAILLVQKNEETINQKGEKYSPGVKGGGDAAAAADFLLCTQYDGAKKPNDLTIQLKLARHARPGSQNYRINAQCGLILNFAGTQGVTP